MIPYGRQSISKNDISAVIKVLKSAWLTQGPSVASFEKALAKFCGARYAVVAANGTAALHLACLALGVGKGDEIITSPNSFAATSNSVLYCGGKPVFCDIESRHQNIDPDKIDALVTSKTKGIIPVHFAGHPCDMKKIHSLAKKRGLFVLEDACHALGAEYKSAGKKIRIGSCAHSDAVIFSFHPVKTIATGEGGAILTNRADIYEKLLMYRTHGITKDAGKLKDRSQGSWYYEMQELGFNYRMSDLQAALGESQLKSLPGFVRKRRQIAGLYQKAFAGLDGVFLPSEAEDANSAYHLFVVRLDLNKMTAGRKVIFEALKKAGIGAQVHYIPIHYQPFYQKLGYRRGSMPVCEKYYEQAISLPLFPAMTHAQIQEVIRKFSGVIKEYSR